MDSPDISLNKNLKSNLESSSKKTSTKQRILNSATHLFAKKGYTETTIREIASFIGMTEASIYNHFASKNAILEFILEEYNQLISTGFFIEEKLSELKENPSVEAILSCVALDLPEDKEEYYSEKRNVILQEQHRNPIVRKFVQESVFYSTEQVFATIINKLKELGILRPDTDSDFWGKICSSLIYTFDSRRLLSVGDSFSNFSRMGMIELIRNVFDIMLKMCGTENDNDT